MSAEINVPGKEVTPSMDNSTSKKRSNNYFDGLPVSKTQVFLYIIIVMAYFFEQLDNNNFSFISPALMASWGLQKPQIAQITSLYFLGMTLGGLSGGVISDIIGRRKTFLAAILIFSSMSVLNGLTNSFTVFMLSRALTGFGIFCMMVVSIAYIAEMTPGESRGKWQSLTAAGGFCAMPVIGFISRAIIPMSPEAWRIIFYIGGIGFIGFFLGVKYLKESPRWLVSKGRVAEAEKVVEDLTGVAVDLSEVAKQVPKKASTVEQLVGMFTGKYLKRTLVLLLLFVPCGVGTFATSVWMPTLLVGKGFTLAQSLSVGTAFMLGGPVGLFLSSFFSDKGGRKIPIGIGTLILAALTVVFATLGNTYVTVMIVAFLINAFIMGTGFINMAYVAEHYPTKMRNTSVGLINASQRFGVSGSQLLIPLIMAGVGFKGLFLLGPLCAERIGKIKPFLAPISILGAVVMYFTWISSGVITWILLAILGFFMGICIPLLMSYPMLLPEIGPAYAGSAGGLIATLQLSGACFIPSFIVAPLAKNNFDMMFMLAAYAILFRVLLRIFCPRWIRKIWKKYE